MTLLLGSNKYYPFYVFKHMEISVGIDTYC